jgi:hypothetical protein
MLVVLSPYYGLQRRDWIERLYDIIFPPLAELGSVSCLSLKSIPEAANALHVVIDWIRESFYALHNERHDRMLTEFMRLCALAIALDRAGAQNYIRRAPCITDDVPPFLRRHQGTNTVSLLHDLTLHQDVAEGPIYLALFLRYALL